MLLFNWVGYRLVSYYLQTKADKSLEARIEKLDYHDSELIEMRIALNMPYQNDQPDFERVDGELEIKGQLYKYVKRKVEKGELVLMCLPHKSKENIRNATADFFKITNDLQQESKGKKSDNTSSPKSFAPEYRTEDNHWSLNLSSTSIQISYGDEAAAIPAVYDHDTPAQPPEYC